MIHTDEDDEFERIARENTMRGQPYFYAADPIEAAVLEERDRIANFFEALHSAVANGAHNYWLHAAHLIREGHAGKRVE